MKTLKVVIALLVLLVLFWAVDLGELWGALSKLTVKVVVYLLLLSVALIYVSALKWRLFLFELGNKISTTRLFGLYLVGYFVNLLLPSYLGGDAVRSWYAGKKASQHAALAATILERYTGLLAMLFLALILMWFAEVVSLPIKYFVLVITLGILVVTFLLFSERAMLFAEKRLLPDRFAKHARQVQEGLVLAKGNRTLLSKALLLSFVFHSLTVVNTIVAAYGVGWVDVPLWDLFVVLPLILLISAIPATPSGLGIQEGAFFFFLQGIGASPAEALGVSLVLRAKSYLLAGLGGLVFLSLKESSIAD